MGVVGRLAKWATGLGLAILALTVAAVLFVSERNLQLHGNGRGLERPVDAIVVLGSGADGDGVLGYSSRRRVAVPVDLLKAGKARKLILAGGVMASGVPSVAELMRDYAIGLGAPPEALLVETGSATTFENLRLSFEIAEAHGFETLAISTDSFHLERAVWLAGYFGQPDIGRIAVPGLEHDPNAVRFWMVPREAMAWWLNLAKVAGWEILAATGIPPEARQEWIR